MTVDDLRKLLSQGRRLADEAVLRGVERLAEEHLGRLSEPMVADELPRCLHQVRLIRRDLEAGGDGAAEAAGAALRLLRARTAFAAAPREGGARVSREYKELIDACIGPLLNDCTVRGVDDLALFLETVYAYCHFHHHLARARKRSELRKRRREEQAARAGTSEPVRGPPSESPGGDDAGPPRTGRRDRRRRRREGPPAAGGEPVQVGGPTPGEPAPPDAAPVAEPTAAGEAGSGGPAAPPPTSGS